MRLLPDTADGAAGVSRRLLITLACLLALVVGFQAGAEGAPAVTDAPVKATPAEEATGAAVTAS